MPRVMDSTAGPKGPGQPAPRPSSAPRGPDTGAIPFEVLAEIASGATARVDLCRVLPPHPRKGQLLAVKRLHSDIADDPTFVNQFLDEVWMTASLKHPNVVEVAGFGTDEEGSYLAFELVQGVSLLRLMKTIFDTGEAFTERMVVYLGACICRGLAAAHALRAPNGELLGLVHRDLTPGNVLVGFTGDVKIADFGTAKAKQRLTRTITGMRKGEPSYMAPELARSGEIDARADLFSFGVLLFELFAGRHPWSDKNAVNMVQVMAREPPADLRALRPKIDRELVNIVMRCLERDPAARFQSAHEVAARFDEWLTLHGYQEGNDEALGRFVRRNAMRQMRWFERAIAGEMPPESSVRELHPRVPTYTENSAAPKRPTEPPRINLPAPPPAPVGRSGPQKPLVPPRAGAVPVDPRALRAQNAVEQLKKLAPAPEPPRPRGGEPNLPRLDADDDGDVTDVEMRVDGVRRSSAPSVHPAFEDEPLEGEEGEEAPTLVQKGDAKIKALREASKQAAKVKPPYVSPGLIHDEESDQRITAVKREEQRAAAHGVVSIIDPESELPTEPVQARRAAEIAQQVAANVRVPAAPVVIPQAPAPHDLRKTPPARPQIPAAPDIPKPRGPEPPPPVAVPAPPSYEPSRASASDEVQVIDRNVLRQQVLHTEEGIVAESDRLAIEAVRRAEEARAAQARAERKAAQAKAASDAARIAAEAVQMIRTAGIAAAARRLEDAHAIEHGAPAGRFAAAESAADIPVATPSRSSVFPPPTSQPYALPADAFPGVDAARARAIAGTSVGPQSAPPPLSDPALYAQRPAFAPTPVYDGGPLGKPSSAPKPPVGPAPMAPRPPAPTPPPSSAPVPPMPPAFDIELTDRREQRIFGLSTGALTAVALVVVVLVIALAVVLAR